MVLVDEAEVFEGLGPFAVVVGEEGFEPGEVGGEGGEEGGAAGAGGDFLDGIGAAAAEEFVACEVELDGGGGEGFCELIAGGEEDG